MVGVPFATLAIGFGQISRERISRAIIVAARLMHSTHGETSAGTAIVIEGNCT